jgi:hypothetical protein
LASVFKHLEFSSLTEILLVSLNRSLPSGYSVGPTAVWNPQGQVVSSLPPDAISQVAVRPTSVSPPSPVLTPRGFGTRSGSTPSQNGNGGQNANVVYVAGFMASRV